MTHAEGWGINENSTQKEHKMPLSDGRHDQKDDDIPGMTYLLTTKMKKSFRVQHNTCIL
jgi:hypothetical protein